MSRTPEAAVAEFVGTFCFVLVGAGAVVLSTLPDQVGLLGVAAAHGLALAVMVTVFGGISGGHFNPAVTFGVLVTGRIRPVRAGIYVLAQLGGAVLAGLVLRVFFTPAQWGGPNLGTPAIGSGVTVGRAILIEAVLTFVLLIAVWGTGVDPRGANVGGFAIGFAVFADILVGGPLTGAAMNPARHFGPALASGFWSDWWVYWVGPLLGGALGSLVWTTFFASGRDVPPAVAAGATQDPASGAERRFGDGDGGSSDGRLGD